MLRDRRSHDLDGASELTAQIYPFQICGSDLTSFKSTTVICFGISDFGILKSQTFLSFIRQSSFSLVLREYNSLDFCHDLPRSAFPLDLDWSRFTSGLQRSGDPNAPTIRPPRVHSSGVKDHAPRILPDQRSWFTSGFRVREFLPFHTHFLPKGFHPELMIYRRVSPTNRRLQITSGLRALGVSKYSPTQTSECNPPGVSDLWTRIPYYQWSG
jgi:hypothetical protein